MDYWQFIFAMINSLAIIVTLVILIIQTNHLAKQTKDANEVSRSLSLNQRWEMFFKIDEIFLEKPYLRKYFYQDIPKDKIDPSHAVDVKTTAETILDIMELALLQADLFPDLHIYDQRGTKSINIRDVMHKYFCDMLVSSPCLLEFAENKNRDGWYTTVISDIIEDAHTALNKRKSAVHS